jgi:hypothetical protein
MGYFVLIIIGGLLFAWCMNGLLDKPTDTGGVTPRAGLATGGDAAPPLTTPGGGPVRP